MDFFPSAFSAMASYTQFIVYQLAPSQVRPGKTDKFPSHHATGIRTGINDQSMWTDPQTAIAAAKRLGSNYGVGFVLTQNDPFFLLDIDNCWDEVNNKWSDLAVHLCSALQGAALEVSSSMRGLHIIGSGTAPDHMCNPPDSPLEFYTANRFVALTGINASGDAGINCTPTLSWLVENYFKKSESSKARGDFEWTTEPAAEWNGPEDDDLLIGRMLKSSSARSVFNEAPTFADLWNANAAVLSRNYSPDKSNDSAYNESSADMALASHLAFWTGNNCERMLRLMQRSQLVRDKWERPSYLETTIRTACSRQKEFLKDAHKSTTSVQNGQQQSAPTILGAEGQDRLFAGCVYVQDRHEIMIPGGVMLDQGRFRAAFGGDSFVMGPENTKLIKNAWEAFTEGQFVRRPRVNSSTFRPDMPPGAVFDRFGESLVNTYWPLNIPCVEGDASPFIRHVQLLLGDPNDIEIIISYMAAIIQHKGVKFKWTPLIQGVEGNGKSLLSTCIAYCIGDKYCYFPRADEIASRFNSWMYGTIFYGVNDIYNADGTLRKETMENLKPMITEERLDIEGKNKDKCMRDICGNFIINSNHQDALKITRNSRRFAPLFCRQQEADDKTRDGLTQQYFVRLINWLKNENGFAIVHHYLANYPIKPELNPAIYCLEAPKTSSTETAIRQSVGRVEQEVLEAIETEEIGFKKGWVSSKYLDLLLEDKGCSRMVPHNKRRQLMQSLGYDWHPRLKEGRATSKIMPENSRSVLYITKDHPSLSLEWPMGVTNSYTEDQA